MSFCFQCSSINDDNARFCAVCGAKLSPYDRVQEQLRQPAAAQPGAARRGEAPRAAVGFGPTAPRTPVGVGREAPRAAVGFGPTAPRTPVGVNARQSAPRAPAPSERSTVYRPQGQPQPVNRPQQQPPVNRPRPQPPVNRPQQPPVNRAPRPQAAASRPPQGRQPQPPSRRTTQVRPAGGRGTLIALWVALGVLSLAVIVLSTLLILRQYRFRDRTVADPGAVSAAVEIQGETAPAVLPGAPVPAPETAPGDGPCMAHVQAISTDLAYLHITRLEYRSYEDAYVRALQVGDLVDEGTGTARVTEIREENGVRTVLLDDACSISWSGDRGMWILRWPSDAPVFWENGEFSLPAAAGLSVWDEQYAVESGQAVQSWSLAQIQERYGANIGVYTFRLNLNAGVVTDATLIYLP